MNQMHKNLIYRVQTANSAVGAGFLLAKEVFMLKNRN